MPRKPCYWTRQLELDLVEYVRSREFIWQPVGNTNHHIQQKYKAYAEFAARLGRGFTARSVRDRWVNIRSTFNHNMRRVEKSKETAKSPSDIFVPCWPLWKPLQFLKDISKKQDLNNDHFSATNMIFKDASNMLELKEEQNSDVDDLEIGIRQRGQRTDRPRKRKEVNNSYNSKSKCKQVIDDLLEAMRPISTQLDEEKDQIHWFFSKYVVGRLNTMRKSNAQCAAENILKLLVEYQTSMEPS